MELHYFKKLYIFIRTFLKTNIFSLLLFYHHNFDRKRLNFELEFMSKKTVIISNEESKHTKEERDS